MGRPRKPRSLESIPRPVVYIPSGWTRKQTKPIEVAIEDFEVMRLVDGHSYGIEEAALKIGVGKSTAGRMLERARRQLALGIERRSPVFLDALESSILKPPKAPVQEFNEPTNSCHSTLAVAYDETQNGPEVSRIFGRAPEFAIVGENHEIQTYENPGFGRQRDAATQAIELLKRNGVGRVVAGRYGPDALQQLGEAGIDPVIAIGVSLEEAIELFSLAKG